MKKARTLLAIILVCMLTVSLSPSAFARESKSTRNGTSLYPLYWSAYEPCFTADAPLSEARWKANIDWVGDNLLSSGYNMVTTDGWLGGSTQTTENGYLLKYNDNWTHDPLFQVGVSLGIEKFCALSDNRCLEI